MTPGLHFGRRHFLSLAGAAVAAPAVAASGSETTAETVVAEVETGKLRGLRSGGAVSFKGVPYAAPTGGVNRFMAPRPVEGWIGVRDALRFGDRCPQEGGGVERQLAPGDWFSWYARPGTYSEDCCVLNLYTPDLNPRAKRPVMVYIHGGGFRSGSGDGAALDGTNLATVGDVVVVTLNHRLNLLGYLPLGHLDETFSDAANAGQLDLIAALRWIRTNIGAFGGDPGRVLLFGQSGGGSKIATLMIMPAAKGLLHRAVNMSGTTAYGMGPVQAREPITDEFLKELEIGKTDLRKLQALPPEQLLIAYRRVVNRLRTDDFRPVIDGRHIPHAPLDPKGLAVHADVPMIMGTTETEATLWLGRDPRNLTVTAPQVKQRITAQFSLDERTAEAIHAAYQKEDPSRRPWDILVAFTTDVLFRGRMLVGAEAKASARAAPVYLYNFVWKSPADGGIWASPHTADIPFAFGNVHLARTMTGPGPVPDEVSRRMMSAFVAFARTGDPNSPAIPRWSPYETKQRLTMAIGQPFKLVSDLHGVGRVASRPYLHQDALRVQNGPLMKTS